MTNGKLPVNRTYKARLFELIFSRKRELLELYNAVNGTEYDNPELLEINTLENAIYMSMHNDVSFIIDSRLALYEHQSTYSANLPLRCLMYVSDLYSAITKDANLYGRKLVQLPTPHFLIFYNGEEEQPEVKTLRLSDAYTVSEKEPSLELVAVMLNINQGHNMKLLESCKTLGDYSEYTKRVRVYTKEMDIESAVEKAITECISDGILSEFLSKYRAEVKSVSIYEYDEEKHMQQVKAEGEESGRREGQLLKLINLIQIKYLKGKSLAQTAEDLEEDVGNIEDIYRIIAENPDLDNEDIICRIKKEVDGI